MKKTILKSVAAVSLCLTLFAGGVSASATYLECDDGTPQNCEGFCSCFVQKDDKGQSLGQKPGIPGEGQPFGQMSGTPGEGQPFGQMSGVPGEGQSIGQMNGVPGEGQPFGQMNGVPGEGQSIGQMNGTPGESQPFGQMNGVPGEGQPFGQMNGVPGEGQPFGQMNGIPGEGQPFGQMPGMFGESQDFGQQSGMPGENQQSSAPGSEQGGSFSEPQGGSGMIQASTDTAGEIVTGVTANSAMDLNADYISAVTFDVSENSDVKITEAGTYIITGTAAEGSITVKKGTTGVVLILKDLDLTSSNSAALSINKGAEVQVVISGNVKLTDNENPEDEYSTDEAVADAYDGAAIKVKAGAQAYLTGDGTLTVLGNAKNSIKAGDESSLIIDGVTLNISAVNDGINGNFDVTILSGAITVSAGDDGIHADHILTIGEDGTGPDLTIASSNEGLEGTVVNIAGGIVNVNATDDGINAANKDGVYEGELAYSVNITGGSVTVTTQADGMDSNGNVNLIGGSASIRSASAGGDAGIDYDGALYISDSFRLNNQSGVAGPDGMGGVPGPMGGAQEGFGGGMNGGYGGNMGGGFLR